MKQEEVGASHVKSVLLNSGQMGKRVILEERKAKSDGWVGFQLFKAPSYKNKTRQTNKWTHGIDQFHQFPSFSSTRSEVKHEISILLVLTRSTK